MSVSRFLPVVVAIVFLLGCKVKITVPEGGRVESESGTYVCLPGENCVIDVVDAFFDETFVAIPDPGYTFAAWNRRKEAFCRGKDEPCRLFTTLFPGTPLMQFLERDDTYHLEADFAKSNQWTAGADMLEGAGAISSCAVNGIVYVFGIGWSSYSSVPVGVAKYDSVSDRWTSLPDMPSRQGWATAGVVKGKCYVIGGASSFGGVASTAVYEFDPKNESWRVRSSLPDRRTMAAAAVVDNKIYVVGGGDDDSFLPDLLPSVAIYDPATDSWSKGADMPTPRFLLAAAAVDGKIYAIGGTSDENNVLSDIVERYDPVTNKWTTVENMPAGRRGHSANVLRGIIYVVAGVAQGSDLTTVRFDPQSNTWSNGVAIKNARFAHNSLTVDGHIIAFGGFNSSRDLTTSEAKTEIFTD
jgi:N-acetylneuraminic acid mutarotase